jgi:hypothetical protein
VLVLDVLLQRLGEAVIFVSKRCVIKFDVLLLALGVTRFRAHLEVYLVFEMRDKGRTELWEEVNFKVVVQQGNGES